MNVYNLGKSNYRYADACASCGTVTIRHKNRLGGSLIFSTGYSYISFARVLQIAMPVPCSNQSHRTLRKHIRRGCPCHDVSNQCSARFSRRGRNPLREAKNADISHSADHESLPSDRPLSASYSAMSKAMMILT